MQKEKSPQGTKDLLAQNTHHRSVPRNSLLDNHSHPSYNHYMSHQTTILPLI